MHLYLNAFGKMRNFVANLFEIVIIIEQIYSFVSFEFHTNQMLLVIRKWSARPMCNKVILDHF